MVQDRPVIEWLMSDTQRDETYTCALTVENEKSFTIHNYIYMYTYASVF